MYLITRSIDPKWYSKNNYGKNTLALKGANNLTGVLLTLNWTKNDPKLRNVGKYILENELDDY